MKYLLLDTALCNAYTIYELKKEFGVNSSLFKNTADENLEDVAPYLFEIGTTDFKLMFAENPYVNLNTYILLDSPDAFMIVFNHLQKYIYKVKDDKKYFFRFFDPGVLHKYLTESAFTEIKLIFGHINMFIVSQNETNALTRFWIEKNTLQNEKTEYEKIFHTNKKDKANTDKTKTSNHDKSMASNPKTQ